MVSHLNRHFKKGETEASYSGSSNKAMEEPAPFGQAYNELLKELRSNVQLLQDHTPTQKIETYFNPEMKTNSWSSVHSLFSQRRNPLECLDACGATGIMGLQWAKHLCNAVKVTITDINDRCIRMMKQNCELNNIRVEEDERGSQGPDRTGTEAGTAPMATVEVSKMDAKIIMHRRPFDYIHLDPFGATMNHLDDAFKNVCDFGIISVTSTDTGSLYAKSPNVTLRRYDCHIVPTEYYKELAARMLVASVSRAAARCNKGIEVLLAVALEHFVLVVVRVLRGPSQADETRKVQKIRELVHCQWCEERVFLSPGNIVDDTLPCDCHRSLPGKTAVQLGPLWDSGNVLKKLKPDSSLEHPPFYYSIPRHRIRGMNMPKLNKFLRYLTEAGFRVSRTHFDPTAVRTDATLQQFKSVLTKCSVPTFTNSVTSTQTILSDETPL